MSSFSPFSASTRVAPSCCGGACVFFFEGFKAISAARARSSVLMTAISTAGSTGCARQTSATASNASRKPAGARLSIGSSGSQCSRSWRHCASAASSDALASRTIRSIPASCEIASSTPAASMVSESPEALSVLTVDWRDPGRSPMTMIRALEDLGGCMRAMVRATPHATAGTAVQTRGSSQSRLQMLHPARQHRTGRPGDRGAQPTFRRRPARSRSHRAPRYAEKS